MRDSAYEAAGKDLQDDVSALFLRLGASGEAGNYRDFTPAALPPRPVREAALPIALEPLAESTSPLAPVVHQSRSLPAPQCAPAGEAGVAGLTPLEQIFQRLLQANVPPQSGDLLKRLFAR